MIISLSGRIGSGKDTVGNIIQYLMHTEGRYDAAHWESLQQRRSQGLALIQPNWQNYWEIKKFAGKLKEIASLMLGIPVTDFEKQEVKDSLLGEEWWYYTGNHTKTIITQNYYKSISTDSQQWWELDKPTVRWFLQTLGTDAIRNNLHPNAWVNALMSDYQNKWNNLNIARVAHEVKGEEYPNWIITDTRFPNEFDTIKSKGGICIKIERACAYCTGVNHHKMGCENPEENKRHISETALDNHIFDYVLSNNGNSIEDLIFKVKIMLTELKLI